MEVLGTISKNLFLDTNLLQEDKVFHNSYEYQLIILRDNSRVISM